MGNSHLPMRKIASVSVLQIKCRCNSKSVSNRANLCNFSLLLFELFQAMSTRIRTFLKASKYNFYPDWCGRGLSLFPTGKRFQNNVLLVTGFTCFVWTELRPIGLKEIRSLKNIRICVDVASINTIQKYFSYCNTIGQSNNAFSILGVFLAGKWIGHVLIFLTDKTNNEHLPKPFFKVILLIIVSIWSITHQSLSMTSHCFSFSITYSFLLIDLINPKQWPTRKPKLLWSLFTVYVISCSFYLAIVQNYKNNLILIEGVSSILAH